MFTIKRFLKKNCYFYEILKKNNMQNRKLHKQRYDLKEENKI